jgi:hypothetical protein
MGALMIVVPAHARNLTGTSQPAHGECRAKQHHSDKNQNVNDWLAEAFGASRIDVLAGNR